MMPAAAKLSLVLAILALQTREVVCGQEVHFQRRPAQVHDVSRQLVNCELSAERSIRQQNQLVDSSTQQLHRQQERTLTILGVQAGRPQRAKITYHQSATKLHQADRDAIKVSQPVTGKTYLVTLQGEELVITDLQGQVPPTEELEIVQRNLQAFGKTNPLAAFLHGKTVRMGQSLEVPKEVARELLGLTGNQGDTEKLSMKLIAVKNIESQRCAVFETLLRTTNQEVGSMTLLMKGELTIEEASCRTRSIVLRGPVALSELRGPAGARFTVSTNGTLEVAVEARYGSRRLR